MKRNINKKIMNQNIKLVLVSISLFFIIGILFSVFRFSGEITGRWSYIAPTITSNECTNNYGTCISASSTCNSDYLESSFSCDSVYFKCCIPNKGHPASTIKVRVVPTSEVSVQDIFGNDSLKKYLICASFNRTEGSSSIGASSFTYSPDASFIPSGVIGILDNMVQTQGTTTLRCKQENGWVMTGCSSATTSDPDNDERMGANNCTGDTDGTNLVSIRCCKLVDSYDLSGVILT